MPPLRYRSGDVVAGVRLIVRTDFMASFAEPRAAGTDGVAAPPSGPAGSATPQLAGTVVYEGEGSVGDRSFAVTSRFDPAEGYLVDVAGRLALRVAADGSEAAVWAAGQAGGDPVDARLVVDTLLGPGLVLATALQGRFCLHASAVALRDRAVAFVGGSGSGKSTLARLLGELAPPWRRIGDDVLPVGIEGGVPVARPHFPQLKLPVEEHGDLLRGVPETIPLASIYVLEAGTTIADEPPRPTATGLSPANATLTLVAHTVAARLFAPDLTARHLSVCAEIAGAVPVRRLVLPRRLDVGREVAAVIEAELARQAGS